MFEIFDSDGNSIGEITLSQKQQKLLEDVGGSVVTIFHTPKMLQHVLGNDNGSFEITRRADPRAGGDRLVVAPESLPALRRYLAMKIAIRKIGGAF